MPKIKDANRNCIAVLEDQELLEVKCTFMEMR